MASQPPICWQCFGNSGDFNMMKLDCGTHYVCAPCLKFRATEDPTNLLKCTCAMAFPFQPNYALTSSNSPVRIGTSWQPQQRLQMQPQFQPRIINGPPFSGHQESQPCVLMHPPNPGVWIFVDDSNIWIEAKKLVGQLKHFNSHEDHRVRIDVGKLTDVVARGRNVANRYLYGSEPPPIDTVWKKISQLGWNVVRHRRDLFSGREKQIDTQLVADVTEVACTTPSNLRTTIVLVTGDVNTILAIEKVMKNAGWTVEVHMWEHAVSSALKKFSREYPGKILIDYLNRNLQQITFTSMDFNYNNKFLQTRAKAYGVVITMVQSAFKNKLVDKVWIRKIEEIAHWPFQYFWITKGQDADDLLLVFNRDKGSSQEFDLANFLLRVRPEITAKQEFDSDDEDSTKASEMYSQQNEDKSLEQIDDRIAIPHSTMVQTFMRYDQKKSEVLQKAIFTHPGVYSLNDVLESGGNRQESGSEEASKDESEFQLVHSASQKQLKRAQLFSDECPYKYNCIAGIQCRFSHTSEQQAYFHQHSGHGNRYRKVKLCMKYENGTCRLPDKQCEYAHGPEDAWCMTCRSNGHFTDIHKQ